MAHSKLQTIQSIALAAAIVIVFNLFVNFGVRAFYDSPKMEKFCSQEKVSRTYADQYSCAEIGGFWYEAGTQYSPRGPYPARPILNPDESEDPQGWCDAYFTCGKEFQSAQSVYNRNVFSVLIVAGLIALAAGLFMQQTASVSTGLIFGGVLSFIVGTIRYWSDMQEYFRFAILGIALIVLIWLGICKLKR